MGIIKKRLVTISTLEIYSTRLMFNRSLMLHKIRRSVINILMIVDFKVSEIRKIWLFFVNSWHKI